MTLFSYSVETYYLKWNNLDSCAIWQLVDDCLSAVKVIGQFYAIVLSIPPENFRKLEVFDVERDQWHEIDQKQQTHQ